jgi:hypothetical protein
MKPRQPQRYYHLYQIIPLIVFLFSLPTFNFHKTLMPAINIIIIDLYQIIPLIVFLFSLPTFNFHKTLMPTINVITIYIKPSH